MRNQWLVAILIAPFVKGCVYPGWSSAAELAFSCALVAFLTYFRPERSIEEQKLSDLNDRLNSVQEQVRAVNVRLGFQRGA